MLPAFFSSFENGSHCTCKDSEVANEEDITSTATRSTKRTRIAHSYTITNQLYPPVPDRHTRRAEYLKFSIPHGISLMEFRNQGEDRSEIKEIQISRSRDSVTENHNLNAIFVARPGVSNKGGVVCRRILGEHIGGLFEALRKARLEVPSRDVITSIRSQY